MTWSTTGQKKCVAQKDAWIYWNLIELTGSLLFCKLKSFFIVYDKRRCTFNLSRESVSASRLWGRQNVFILLLVSVGVGKAALNIYINHMLKAKPPQSLMCYSISQVQIMEMTLAQGQNRNVHFFVLSFRESTCELLRLLSVTDTLGFVSQPRSADKKQTEIKRQALTWNDKWADKKKLLQNGSSN